MAASGPSCSTQDLPSQLMDSLVAVRGLQKFPHVGALVMTRGFSRPAACGILIPQLGIEPASPALHGGLLTTDWTTREVSPPCFLSLAPRCCLPQAGCPAPVGPKFPDTDKPIPLALSRLGSTSITAWHWTSHLRSSDFSFRIYKARIPRIPSSSSSLWFQVHTWIFHSVLTVPWF